MVAYIHNVTYILYFQADAEVAVDTEQPRPAVEEEDVVEVMVLPTDSTKCSSHKPPATHVEKHSKSTVFQLLDNR